MTYPSLWPLVTEPNIFIHECGPGCLSEMDYLELLSECTQPGGNMIMIVWASCARMTRIRLQNGFRLIWLGLWLSNQQVNVVEYFNCTTYGNNQIIINNALSFFSHTLQGFIVFIFTTSNFIFHEHIKQKSIKDLWQ